MASVSDLENPQYQEIFSKLDREQGFFIHKESVFRSKEYKWPRDPLHCWSRIWEYPYVYYHLAGYLKELAKENRPIVADVGSGVTFFPFTLARLGYEVVCTDVDPVCQRDLLRARKTVFHSPGKVNFRLIDNCKLPFKDKECNAVYCISVLEHIPQFENTIIEMARVLKPDGLCLITCDLGLDLMRNTQLNVTQFKRLISVVEEQFNMFWPERTVHPLDVLTNRNSPFPDHQKSYVRTGWQLIKQKILKPILGRKPGQVNIGLPSPMTIFGMVLQKRTMIQVR